MKLVYPTQGRKGHLMLAGHDGDLMEYATIGEEEKQLTLRKHAIAQRIQISMGEHTRAEAADFRISWKPGQRITLDTAAIKAEHPEIYRRYMRNTSTRTFRVTAKKGG